MSIEGGSLFVTNCIFVSNIAPSGGAITVNASEVAVNGTTFTFNRAFYVWWKHADDSSAFKHSASETVGKAKRLALRFMETYDQHLKTKLKLFVGFFQVSSLLHASYQCRTRTRS